MTGGVGTQNIAGQAVGTRRSLGFFFLIFFLHSWKIAANFNRMIPSLPFVY